jgi:hypothetical protein
MPMVSIWRTVPQEFPQWLLPNAMNLNPSPHDQELHALSKELASQFLSLQYLEIPYSVLPIRKLKMKKYFIKSEWFLELCNYCLYIAAEVAKQTFKKIRKRSLGLQWQIQKIIHRHITKNVGFTKCHICGTSNLHIQYAAVLPLPPLPPLLPSSHSLLFPCWPKIKE